LFIVAVTRWHAQRDLERELPLLAASMGVGLYDARIKLATPLPIFVGVNLTREVAAKRLDAFRALGHGAVACDVDSMAAPESMRMIRSFELGADALLGVDAQQRPCPLKYAGLRGIVRAAALGSVTQTLETTIKKLSVGRALLSGGLLLQKSVTNVHVTASSERQQVTYLFHDGHDAPVLLKEHSMNYEGLGPKRGHSTLQSFTALVDVLRHNAPAAFYDARLVAHKRLADLSGVHAVGGERTISTSNSDSIAAAAFVLMLAHTEGQL
jgi:hypothetical protein